MHLHYEEPPANAAYRRKSLLTVGLMRNPLVCFAIQVHGFFEAKCTYSYCSVSQPVVRDDGTGGPQADLN
jgi:hypothetical protein